MNWTPFLIWCRNFWALLLTPVVLLTGASASVMELAGEDAIQATRRAYVYDNGRLLLGGYCYDPAFSDAASVGKIKAAGLDFLVCWTSPAFLDECERQGVGVIAAGNPEPHPAIWGNDVYDEPSAALFGELGARAADYYARGDGRVPMINLFPSYANSQQLGSEPGLGSRKYLLAGTIYGDEQLAQYRRHAADYLKAIDTDYISVDIYPYGLDGTHDGWLHNLDILAEACRDTGRDLWVITQAAGNAVEEGGGMRWCGAMPEQLQQSYAALAFGAKAVIYACYQTGWWDDGSHMVNAAGETTATYDAVRDVNARLALFAEKYGEYVWRGAYLVNNHKAAGVRYNLANGLDKKERPQISSRDGLLVGCFDKKDGAGKAYVIVNMMELLEEKTASFTVQFPADTPVTMYAGDYPPNIVTFNGGKKDITLGPGRGMFVTVG